MDKHLCAKCNKEMNPVSAQEINRRFYCPSCAASVKKESVELMKKMKQEKDDLVREIDAIEKEIAVLSQDDTKDIVTTSTDTIEGRRIVEYIDVISVRDILFQRIHFDPLEAESQKELVREASRISTELNLSKLKSQARKKIHRKLC